MLAATSDRNVLRLTIGSRPPLPAEPVTYGAAHDELEITPAEPRQLFGEQRHALAPRAGHARDVGAPEPARGAKGVIKLAQLVVDVAVRVRLVGVARRAGGLHRDVGVLRQRENFLEICPALIRARHSGGSTEVIEDQLEVRMTLRDLADLRKEV